MNEQQYKSLIKRADGIVNRYKNLHFEGSDLLAETYILYGYSDNDNEFSKQMFVLAGKIKTNFYQKNERKPFGEEKLCKDCNDVKPLASFRSWYLRGYLITDTYCAECKNKRLNEYKKIRRAFKKQQLGKCVKMRGLNELSKIAINA